MSNPPFIRENGKPALWFRDLEPKEIEWVAEEKQRLSEAYRKLQTETEKGN